MSMDESQQSHPAAGMLRVHAAGCWAAGQVRVTWGASSMVTVPQVQRLIDQRWAEASRRLGQRLFDGPMCRMESWQATPQRLSLVLSRTSYKPFLGTNLSHPELARQYGPQALANPVGVSSALATQDGQLMFGRRNEQVAYYPGRVHPFAGALEPRQSLDVFDEVHRELAEELSLQEEDIGQVRCLGLVEDMDIRQPELVFRVESRRTLGEIEGQVDDSEHHSGWSIPATRQAVEQAMADPRLTPVAVATLLLWGRGPLGEAWFSAASGRFEGKERSS